MRKLREEIADPKDFLRAFSREYTAQIAATNADYAIEKATFKPSKQHPGKLNKFTDMYFEVLQQYRDVCQCILADNTGRDGAKAFINKYARKMTDDGEGAADFYAKYKNYDDDELYEVLGTFSSDDTLNTTIRRGIDDVLKRLHEMRQKQEKRMRESAIINALKSKGMSDQEIKDFLKAEMHMSDESIDAMVKERNRYLNVH